MKTRQITEMGLLLAVALVFSYLESCLPVMIAVPGVKLGLANMITMLILYHRNTKTAFLFMIVRVLLSGFLFSGSAGILYSFAGGALSIVAMFLLKKCPLFSVLGVSMGGAVFHNVGQIMIAMVLLDTAQMLYYLPVLLVSGTLTGFLIGFLTHFIIKKYHNIFEGTDF